MVLQLFLRLVLQVVADEDQMDQVVVVLEALAVVEQIEVVEEQEIPLQSVHHKETMVEVLLQELLQVVEVVVQVL